MVARKPLRARTDGVDERVRHLNAERAEQHDGIQPEVPADEECGVAQHPNAVSCGIRAGRLGSARHIFARMTRRDRRMMGFP